MQYNKNTNTDIEGIHNKWHLHEARLSFHWTEQENILGFYVFLLRLNNNQNLKPALS